MPLLTQLGTYQVLINIILSQKVNNFYCWKNVYTVYMYCYIYCVWEKEERNGKRMVHIINFKVFVYCVPVLLK